MSASAPLDRQKGIGRSETHLGILLGDTGLALGEGRGGGDFLSRLRRLSLRKQISMMLIALTLKGCADEYCYSSHKPKPLVIAVFHQEDRLQ